MDAMNGITPVLPMGAGDGFGGGNAFFWVFALLVLMGGGFNGFGGNGQQYATRDQVQNGFDTQNMQMQTAGLLNAVTEGTASTIASSTANASNAINAIKDGNASLIREFGNVETALTALSGKQQECCCEILRATDGINYNNAINTAAINATTTAQTQKILDALAQSKIESLQAQVNQLQLNLATSNVLRFPNAWTYAGGNFPPITTTTA